MLNHPEAHALVQQRRQLNDLSAMPENRRAERFVEHVVGQASIKSRQATKIRQATPEMKSKLEKSNLRIERMQAALSNTLESLPPIEPAQEAEFRGRARRPGNAQERRS